MKKILLFIFVSFTFFSSRAQFDSCGLRISLLTCTPGEELYSTFGHSALRVIDSSRGIDVIFNYGTFEFDDPHFYTKFIRGKLLYFVSTDDFTDFVQQFQYEGRGITEQVLNLSCAQKEKMFSALIENTREENKYYKYDFVYDNCTTRLRDMVTRFAGDSIFTKDIRPEKGVTFRDLIHDYLNKGKEYWSELGIDILLGLPLDKKISNNEAMFLPDYLMKAFDSTTIGQEKLVSEKTTILTPQVQATKHVLFSPMVVFSLLFLAIAVLTFLKTAARFFLYFDFLLFFLTGALGILLLFMWFGTDHSTCKYNLNLLWAFPPHIVIAFLINKKKKWVSNYFLSTIFLLLLLVILGLTLQKINIALLPVGAILLLRSLVRYKKLRSNA